MIDSQCCFRFRWTAKKFVCVYIYIYMYYISETVLLYIIIRYNVPCHVYQVLVGYLFYIQ